MVTKRQPVNIDMVNFYDGQRITEEEMEDEQTRNVGIDAANVANFHGSGVLKDDPIPTVILDTDSLNTAQQTLLDGYSFDGSNVYTGTPLTSVSNTTEGVHLAVTLSNVRLDGAASTRIVIIGDEFGGNLIHDELTFESNGTKITTGRYNAIRAILLMILLEICAEATPLPLNKMDMIW